MKRNRTKISITDSPINLEPNFYSSAMRITKSLPMGIYDFVYTEFDTDIENSYYPDVWVLPLTEEGELFREILIKDLQIYRYGVIEHNFIYNGETYLVIIVNND